MWNIRQKELDNREGNAHGMSEIRILAQGELVVLYQKNVWDTGPPFRACYHLFIVGRGVNGRKDFYWKPS